MFQNNANYDVNKLVCDYVKKNNYLLHLQLKFAVWFGRMGQLKMLIADQPLRDQTFIFGGGYFFLGAATSK